MRKVLWPLAFVCLQLAVHGQTEVQRQIVKNKFKDSANAVLLREDQVYDLPIVAINESERSESNMPFVPSLLSANRDVFLTTASFHFNSLRFKMRGYDADLFTTHINGMNMNSLTDGNTQWGLWSGLNEVTKNTQLILGLRPGEMAFGNIGNMVSMDMRASKQRAQTQVNYAFSNRSYNHRWMFTKSMGMNKKGWAYSISGSYRFAAEGYVPGTEYQGGSYFIAIDKSIHENHLLSFLFFGSSVINGRQGAVLEESVRLAGTPSYNPYWGFQGGVKRNANMGIAHQPVVMLIDENRLNNHTTLQTTIGCILGEKSSTSLDWYKAPDPRPDYYHYLPSFQNDSLVGIEVANNMKESESLRQINWNRLYEVNMNSRETVTDVNGEVGNLITGFRSHYILQERVAGIKNIQVNSVFNTRLNAILLLTIGASFQMQQSHYYKKVNDLLGGVFFVDRNQFAERDFPNNEIVIQNDLNHPNRILNTGDIYGYDYTVIHQQASCWAQLNGTKKKFDFFIAGELTYLGYQRDGKMKNGLFPENSYGKSFLNEFTNFGLKGGITYKINGRKYLYLHAAIVRKAPKFDDLFISPRTRDTQQENKMNEKIYSTEFGYIWNAPAIKIRLSAYLTNFVDGMKVITFYHDGYRNFVNYALSGLDKVHFGSELGLEWKLKKGISLNAAIAAGRYYYTSRQDVAVSADNSIDVLEKSVIYSKNFRVSGTPQEAFSLGISYQSSGTLYMNLSANYFRELWLEFNPLRRTYSAVENLVEGSEQWNRVINQTQLPNQFTVDLSGGTLVKVKMFHSKDIHFLNINVGINNLLNNQQIKSGGYEQLRFDVVNRDTNKFPPKYFHSMGLNFSINFSLRI